jgi:hypothetical protein
MVARSLRRELAKISSAIALFSCRAMEYNAFLDTLDDRVTD